MNLDILKINARTYQVINQNQLIGNIALYTNALHDTHIYLKFNLEYYPTMPFPFSKIKSIEQKPLQVMTESVNTALTRFLLQNNFVCKRKCYEAKVTQNDLQQNLSFSTKIYPFNSADSIYETLCLNLYQYYKKVHQEISPLTASYQDFLLYVPTQTGYYDKNTLGQIQNIMFTENNEIAYVISNNLSSFTSFKNNALKKIFKYYQKIFF